MSKILIEKYVTKYGLKPVIVYGVYVIPGQGGNIVQPVTWISM